MEQLPLQSFESELNNCMQETNIMTQSASERKQAIELNHERNIQIKQLVDDFFQTLTSDTLAKKRRWTLAAEHLNQHPEGVEGRGKTWTPQGLARVYQLAEMWQHRRASPQKVTPARKKIYRIITQLVDDGATWGQIADVLNRQGLHWNPKGKVQQPFTNKSANDFYRHHRGLWPHRPRNGSKAQQSLLRFTSVLPPDQGKLDTATPPTKQAPVKPPATTADHCTAKPPTDGSEAPKQARRQEKKVPSFLLSSDPSVPTCSSGEELQVFKRVHDNTSIKVVVWHKKDGDLSVVVRYSGKAGSHSALRMAGMVVQLQQMDYRD